MLLVPLVALNAVPDRSPTAEAAGSRGDRSSDDARSTRLDAAASAAVRASRSAEVAPVETVPPTTVAPAPTAPPTTAEPAPTTAPATIRVKAAVRSTTTTTAKPKPTTTTAKPAPTTTAAPPPPANRQEGGASYYDAPSAETCAHRTLKFGTVLRVTNLENGKRTTCTVNDRGPYIAGRIVDLSEETFARLAPLSEGVIRVSIEW